MRDLESMKSSQSAAAINSCGASMKNIDVKSFMAGMLVVGLVVVIQQNSRSKQQLITYNLHFRDENKDSEIVLHTHLGSAPAGSIDSNRTAGNNSLVDIPNTISDKTECVDSSKSAHIDQGIKGSLYKNGYQESMVTTKGSFHAYGQALALFVHMGSYRGGPDSFAIIGLGAKPAHVYGNAGFECEWVPAAANMHSSIHEGSATEILSNNSIKGKTVKYLPDWNMGRQYTVVVVNCSFEQPVGIDREGGELVVYALYGKGSGRLDMTPERFVALTEKKDEYDAGKFQQPYPYNFVYCGSPLYGNLNAQRIREWMAYHTKLFGKQAHFFLYDAGGVTTSVERVLRPWRKRGFVTLQDIRDEKSYDGYYHNQFLVVNDCLHRTRFLSTWTFFFDVDEYVYVPKEESLESMMQGFSNYTQVIFRQKPMAAHLCTTSQVNISRRWGLEKLVYRNVKAGKTWDRKYAIQARRAFTAGVHRSDNIEGDNIVRESLGYLSESLVPDLWYYHFHNTLTHDSSRELCTTFVEPHMNVMASNGSSEPPDFVDTDGTPYRLDTGLQELALSVKSFELQCIGPFNST